MSDHQPRAIRRAMPHVPSADADASRSFYIDVLGFEEVMDMGWIVTFASATNSTAQISLAVGDQHPVRADITVEVDDVDAVHAEAQRRGLTIVHPLTDEDWGVRRFFVTDPDGTIINVMSHR